MEMTSNCLVCCAAVAMGRSSRAMQRDAGRIIRRFYCSGLGSICGRHFDVIDHEGVDWAFGGFELEAELFLKRGEEVGSVAAGAVVVRFRLGGGELEGEIVFAGEAGLVDDVAADAVV